jgi:hypothetical protein
MTPIRPNLSASIPALWFAPRVRYMTPASSFRLPAPRRKTLNTNTDWCGTRIPGGMPTALYRGPSAITSIRSTSLGCGLSGIESAGTSSQPPPPKTYRKFSPPFVVHFIGYSLPRRKCLRHRSHPDHLARTRSRYRPEEREMRPPKGSLQSGPRDHTLRSRLRPLARKGRPQGHCSTPQGAWGDRKVPPLIFPTNSLAPVSTSTIAARLGRDRRGAFARTPACTDLIHRGLTLSGHAACGCS